MIVALALALGGALTTDAHARATKAPAPALSIESKVCAVGPTDAERSATVTASAILGDDGDRASMKFSIQQRIGKAKWKSVPGSAKSGLGAWETGDAGHAGLRYTKTINGLSEGVQYRILVDARGVDAAGKVVTKSIRKTVTCVQPLFTATLQLVKAVDTAKSDGTHTVNVNLRNAGRLTSDPPVVTVRDAGTLTVLGSFTDDGIKGGGTTKVAVAIPACTGPLYVTVQQEDADPTSLTADQSTTIPCAGASAARRDRR
jgi:hypothetical protein